MDCVWIPYIMGWPVCAYLTWIRKAMALWNHRVEAGMDRRFALKLIETKLNCVGYVCVYYSMKASRISPSPGRHNTFVQSKGL
ncbi:hypothetical protein EV356DRAFT_376877 [Viridothelium virens]|uniref:Uncharacterized protein n=1 Tax=Viridothelium virens TaxID=1048519 RepID=A0A6A6GUV7_VIRVR|nr:hypothetical protein EV356DRAFT_376877 [Viridothelium virens]